MRKSARDTGTVKFSAFIDDKFFLYELDDVIKKTFATEFDRNILIYGSITYLVKSTNNDEVDLATPKKKIKLNFQKDFIKNKMTLELEKVKDEE